MAQGVVPKGKRNHAAGEDAEYLKPHEVCPHLQRSTREFKRRDRSEPHGAARLLRRGRRLGARFDGEQRLEHGEVAGREATTRSARIRQHAGAVLREQQSTEPFAALLRR